MTTILLALLALPAFGQTLEFEAASVKIHPTADANSTGSYLRGGQLVAHNASLKSLVLLAWHVHESQIAGAPAWFDQDGFDVAAKAPADTPTADMRIMLRKLLQERFHLAVHQDQKTMPAYALLIAKQGSKLKPSDPGPIACAPGPGKAGNLHFECRHAATSDMAGTFVGLGHPYLLGLPVVDRTGLTGAWEFSLDWTPWEQSESATPVISFFDALESQVGLRLENQKLPLPVIVIDHADRVPIEN